MTKNVSFTALMMQTQSFPFPVSEDGIEVLGIPMGTEQFICSKCRDIAISGSKLTSHLPGIGDAQSAMLLLRHCHVPTMNYLARSVPLHVLNETVDVHAKITKVTFQEI